MPDDKRFAQKQERTGHKLCVLSYRKASNFDCASVMDFRDLVGADLKQLIYRSQPFGFDNPMLAGILSSARRNNPRHGITGALICRHDLYLQLIEGPPSAIDALFARIELDDRHCDVRRLVVGNVTERMFPAWAMLDDEATSLFWSPVEVAAGALEAASAVALREAFGRLRQKVA